MKKKLLILICAALFFSFNSCEKISGELMFWSDFNNSPIKVYVEDDYQGRIHTDYSSAPECGSEGCVLFSGSPGTYNYTAESEDGTMSWSGTIKIVGGVCKPIYLTDL